MSYNTLSVRRFRQAVLLWTIALSHSAIDEMNTPKKSPQLEIKSEAEGMQGFDNRAVSDALQPLEKVHFATRKKALVAAIFMELKALTVEQRDFNLSVKATARRARMLSAFA